MPGPEALLERALVKHADKRGVLTRKFTSPGHASVPDRLFMLGLTVFVEIKQKGKKPTPAQQMEIDEINLHGGLATWVDNFTDGERIIDLLANPHFADSDVVFTAIQLLCEQNNYWRDENF